MMNFLLATVAQANGHIDNVATDSYNAFIGIVNIILPIVIGVVLVLGMFYGIQLAIKYAKAEEDEEKKKAKGSLINVIVGCLIAIVFIVIVQLVLNGSYIEKLFGNNAITSGL